MEKTRLILALIATAFVGFAGTVNLNSPANYANQAVPGYVIKDNTPASNPITDLGATLGRVLFYDTKLSVDNSTSCGSCHIQQNGFSDLPTFSLGANGNTTRHSMRLINVRFGSEVKFFWDKRAASLEEQASEPLKNHLEMGFSGTGGDPDIDSLLNKMAEIDYYPPFFEAVFGDNAITEGRMQLALAQFMRSIQSFDSKYDVGRAAVASNNTPFPNFTVTENSGKALFMNSAVFNSAGVRVGGGAGCNGCHRAPEFDIDPNSLNNGMVTSTTAGFDLEVHRSPTLRDMLDPTGQSNGPFMHGGNLPSLVNVINHYDQLTLQPFNNKMDPRLLPFGLPQRLNLTSSQKNQLEAFLRTLSGNNVYTDPKWSDPFTGDSIDILFPGCGNLIATTQGVTNNTAVLTWVGGASAHHFELRGGQLGSATVVTLTTGSGSSFQVVMGLQSADFWWQVRPICNADGSLVGAWSNIDTFSTMCPAPDVLSTTSIGTTTATLNWNTVEESAGYRLTGKRLTATATVKIILPSTITSFLASSLLPGTAYQWSVETLCTPSGSWKSQLAPVQNFSTLSAPAKGPNHPSVDGLRIFPNPTTDRLRVHLPASPQHWDVTLIDPTGRVVRRTIKAAANTTLVLSDLGELDAGIYLVEARSAGKRYAERLVIF